MPIDYEQEALREANRIFNQNVKGIVQETQDGDEDDWQPSVSTSLSTQCEWEQIQDKLDIINQRYEQMTSRG